MTARRPDRFNTSKRLQALDAESKQNKQPAQEGIIGRALRAVARLRNDR